MSGENGRIARDAVAIVEEEHRNVINNNTIQKKNIVVIETERDNIKAKDNSLSTDCHYRTFSTLDQDRELALTVQNFTSLYDRRDRSYRRNNDPGNADWEEVAKACEGIRNGEEACRLFEVLKKRYSKKKMNYKRASHYSNSQELIRKAHQELEKYSFMSWLEPFIRFRTVKLAGENRDDSDVIDDEMDDNDARNFILTSNELNLPEEPVDKIRHTVSSDAKRTSSSCPKLVLHKNDNGTLIDTNSEGFSPTSSFPTQVTLSDLRKRCHDDSQTLYNETKTPRLEVPYRLDHQKQPHLLYETRVLKDDDELFAAMVVSQLKKLDKREKCMAKHDISSILFKAQLKQIDQSES